MRRQEEYKNLLKFGMSFIIWTALVAIWGYYWMNYYADIILRPFGYKGNWLLVAVYAILQIIFTSFYGGYRIGYYRREDVIFSGILSLLITNVVTYLQVCLIGRAIMTYQPFISMTVIQALCIAIWGIVANNIYSRLFPAHKMLLVYSGNESAKKLIKKMLSRSEKYQIQQVVNLDDGFQKINDKIMNYESVILCDLPSASRNRLLKFCFANSIRTYTTPKISDILIRGGMNINIFDTPLLLNRNRGPSFEQRVVKRMMDIVVSFILLVVTLPFMLLTAIVIKLYDSGPVFFYQDRCTINNKVFTLVKFRSMIVNAESEGKSVPAVDNDPRITPVGKFIRATRLDELPQLWNIFKGDMSLVGPRPERIEHVKKYSKEIPEFDFRSKMKAGLTGYAQVVGRYNTSAYDKLKMDLMYIANYSLVEDLKLLFMTVKIIFMKSSTEGF